MTATLRHTFELRPSASDVRGPHTLEIVGRGGLHSSSFDLTESELADLRAKIDAYLPGGLGAQLVGVAEIAERTGKTKAAAWTLTKLGGFPEPIRLGMGPVWFWSDVEAFLAVPRRPGPKPKEK